MGLGALRLCVGRRVTTLSLGLERTPRPPFISRFVARASPVVSSPQHTLQASISRDSASTQVSGPPPLQVLLRMYKTELPASHGHSHTSSPANRRAPTRTLTQMTTSPRARPAHADAQGPVAVRASPSAGFALAQFSTASIRRHNARGESCMLSPLALCRCESPGWLSEHSANPALGLARTATGPWASAERSRHRA